MTIETTKNDKRNKEERKQKQQRMKIETAMNENRNNKDFNNQQHQGIVPFPVALQKGTTRNNEKQ